MKVSRFHCMDCKYYYVPDNCSFAMCASPRSGEGYVSGNDCACNAFYPKTTKVKPRRLCDFCERSRPIDDDYGRYSLECVKLIPLPSINLTTVEKTEPKNKAEYAMFIYEDEDDGEVGSFPIKFCPLCGRKLTGEGKK